MWNKIPFDGIIMNSLSDMWLWCLPSLARKIRRVAIGSRYSPPRGPSTSLVSQPDAGILACFTSYVIHHSQLLPRPDADISVCIPDVLRRSQYVTEILELPTKNDQCRVRTKFSLGLLVEGGTYPGITWFTLPISPEQVDVLLDRFPNVHQVFLSTLSPAEA